MMMMMMMMLIMMTMIPLLSVQGGMWFGDDPDSLKESVSKGNYH